MSPSRSRRAWLTQSSWYRIAMRPAVHLSLLLLTLAGLTTGTFAWWVLGRVPGFTGDTYGALCELIEVVTLLALSIGGPS